jgi:hypothetical protein
VADVFSQRADYQVNTTFTISQDKHFVKSLILQYLENLAFSLPYHLVKKKSDDAYNFSIINNVLL